MGQDRETKARELALAHGYEWDTTEEAVKDAWLKKADEVEEAPGVCGKCQDRGFTEQEHGLFREFCDCEKGKELRAEVTGVIEFPAESIGGGIPEGMEVPESITTTSEELSEDNPDYLIIPEAIPGKTLAETADIAREIIKAGKEADENNSGTGQPDTDIGSGDTGKPKRTRKPKAKRKTRAKSGQVFR